MTRYLFIVLIAALTLNTGCKLIYKQNVQQGNAHEQEDLDQIKLGMSKKQVAYLLGTPAVRDPFHNDRWDYIYTYKFGNNDVTRNNLSVFFDNNKLSKIEGEALLQPDKLKDKADDEADSEEDDAAEDTENETDSEAVES